MIDIPLVMFANLAVTDAVNYQKCEKGLFPLLKKSGGEFGTFEDQPLHLDGNSPRPGRIIPSCPSEDISRNWFTDAFDYQALSNCRRAGTPKEFLTLMHHLPRQ